MSSRFSACFIKVGGGVSFRSTLDNYLSCCYVIFISEVLSHFDRYIGILFELPEYLYLKLYILILKDP